MELPNTPILQHSGTPVLGEFGGEFDGKKDRKQRQEEDSEKGALG
jgi:hypothetical protein